MKRYYYGAKNESDIVEAARRAVNTFGGGSKAIRLLLEICCTETDFCQFPDSNPDKLGVSAVQFDRIGLQDIKDRARKRHVKRLYNEYGIVLANVELKDLAYDLDLSFALCRMKFLLIPESIPCKVEGRALYWKRYYNTFHPNAKGTLSKYLGDVKHFFPRGYEI